MNVAAALIALAAVCLAQALWIRRLRRQIADAENQVDALNAALGRRIRFVDVIRD